MVASATKDGRKRPEQAKHLAAYRWKPGQSGNPKGRVPGSRQKLTEYFFRDLCNSWEALGQPALLATAWTQPADYVRVVAGLMPKDVEVTVTNVHLERMNSAQLEALLRREGADNQDPLEAEKGTDQVFRVDETVRR